MSLRTGLNADSMNRMIIAWEGAHERAEDPQWDGHRIVLDDEGCSKMEYRQGCGCMLSFSDFGEGMSGLLLYKMIHYIPNQIHK